MNNFTDVPDYDTNFTIDYDGQNKSYMEYYEDTISFEQKIGIIIPTLFALIIFMGLCGNILVMLVIWFNRQMRNSTNYLIISLAMSDIIFLVFCVPFTAADYALPIWAFSEWWCSALNYVQFVSAYASVWTLVLMALDRFLAVVYPVQSITLRSTRNTSLCLLVLWLLILVSCIPEYFEHKVYDYWFIAEQRTTCTYVAGLTGSGGVLAVRMYYLSFCVCGYCLPLGIASTLYALMLRKLWKMPRPGAPAVVGERNKRQTDSIRAKRKVTWMVTGVIIVFAICWLPMNICFVVRAVMYPSGKHQANKLFVYFSIISQVLAYTNSCVNPILYAFLSDNFRRGFVRIFGFLLCFGKNKDTTTGENFSTPFSATHGCGPKTSLLLSTRKSTVDNGTKYGLERSSLTVTSGNHELLKKYSEPVIKPYAVMYRKSHSCAPTGEDTANLPNGYSPPGGNNGTCLSYVTYSSLFDDIQIMIDDSSGGTVL